MKKSFFVAFVLVFSTFAFAQNLDPKSKVAGGIPVEDAPRKESGLTVDAGVKNVVPKYSVTQDQALVQGYEAYRNEDWVSAMFFLKKAVSSEKYATDEIRYMLISAEMSAGEYKMAVADTQSFISDYPKSMYVPFVQYQKGRAMHYLGNNEQAVLVLSDFCHENPDSSLYPSALYWIAESFYTEYNFDSARSLYERIVNEFSDCEKAVDARQRLAALDQRNREEKLLYLLKVTGEEYLASKEDYERQLKIYKTEDMMGLRRQLNEANKKIADLQRQLDEQTYINTTKNNATSENSFVEKEAFVPKVDVNLGTNVNVYSDPVDSYEKSSEVSGMLSDDPDIAALKRKAHHLQNYMGDKNESSIDAAMKENVYEIIPKK